MEITIQRTTVDRMTDMYVMRFAPPHARFICFTRLQFETLYPHLVLQRGEKIIVKMDLTKIENGV